MTKTCTPADITGDFVWRVGHNDNSMGPLIFLSADPNRIYFGCGENAIVTTSILPGGIEEAGDGFSCADGDRFIAFDFKTCGTLVCAEWWMACSSGTHEFWWVEVVYQPRANNPA